jgi:hypothetical protein
MIMPTVLCLLLSTDTWAEMTKVKVENLIAEFKSSFIDNLNNGKNCELHAHNTLQAVDEAHELFLSDETMKAVLKSMQTLVDSEYYAKQYPQCPFALLPRRSIPFIYMSYYMDNHSSSTIQESSKALSDHLRKKFLEYFEHAYRWMHPMCQRKVCKPIYLSIIEQLRTMHEALNDPKSSLNSIALRLGCLRGALAASHNDIDLDFWNKPFFWFTDALSNMLYLIKNEIEQEFPDKEVPLLKKYQLLTLDYLSHEKNMHSLCPVILSYYLRWLSQDTPDNNDSSILLMTRIHDLLFEELYVAYAKKLYPNSYCATAMTQIQQIPHGFSKDLRSKINASF